MSEPLAPVLDGHSPITRPEPSNSQNRGEAVQADGEEANSNWNPAVAALTAQSVKVDRFSTANGANHAEIGIIRQALGGGESLMRPTRFRHDDVLIDRRVGAERVSPGDPPPSRCRLERPCSPGP